MGFNSGFKGLKDYPISKPTVFSGSFLKPGLKTRTSFRSKFE